MVTADLTLPSGRSYLAVKSALVEESLQLGFLSKDRARSVKPLPCRCRHLPAWPCPVKSRHTPRLTFCLFVFSDVLRFSCLLRPKQLVSMDVSKTGEVFDFFVSCGWVCEGSSDGSVGQA